MKDKFLVIKNNCGSGAYSIEQVLDEHKIPYQIVNRAKGEGFPSPINFRALIVLGGPDRVPQLTDKTRKDLVRVKEALDASIPILGVCLGHQLLVKAAGGEVHENPTPEIALRGPDNEFFTIDLTDEGRADPFFKDIPDHFPTFQVHSDAVTLTDEMTLLATGKYCPVQAAKIRPNAYSTQFHFEITPERFEIMLKVHPDLVKIDTDQLTKDFYDIQKVYGHVSHQLVNNFLKIIE